MGIARGVPDDMKTNDPLKTSEGFAFVCVPNFKFSKIFLSASELRVLRSLGAGPEAKVEITQSKGRSIPDLSLEVIAIGRSFFRSQHFYWIRANLEDFPLAKPNVWR